MAVNQDDVTGDLALQAWRYPWEIVDEQMFCRTVVQ